MHFATDISVENLIAGKEKEEFFERTVVCLQFS